MMKFAILYIELNKIIKNLYLFFAVRLSQRNSNNEPLDWDKLLHLLRTEAVWTKSGHGIGWRVPFPPSNNKVPEYNSRTNYNP